MVDLLRACYTTAVRFYADDPRTTTIQWYFVDRRRPVMPFANVYCSAQWDNPDGLWNLPGYLDAPGEVMGDLRPFRTGRPVGRADGSRLCGTAAQWDRALNAAVDGFGTLAPGGDITCCVGSPDGAGLLHRGIKDKAEG